MSKRAEQWLRFATENLEAARILLSSGHFNPCLQNVQQAVEKSLKALIIARGLPLRRTHSILDLLTPLMDEELDVSLSEDDCHLLDSIYLPSKYPLGEALPEFAPNEALCRRCLSIAERVREGVAREWG